MSYPWFALQVRTRYENFVTAHLTSRGFEWFLPFCKSRRRWSDRFKEVEEPLFPGYVFCRLNPFNRLPVLTTPGVARIVGIGKIPVPVEDIEIAAIQAAIESGHSRQPWKYTPIGQKVRIEQGPLCGLEGILLGLRGNHHLVLSVTLLRRSIAVQIEDASVTPILETSQLVKSSAVEAPALS